MINEFAVLVLLAAAGVSASWLLGIRRFWLHLPVGLAVVTLLRVLTFSTLNLFDARSLLNPLYYSELFVILLWAAWAARKQMYYSFWVAVGFSIISVVSTRIWGWNTPPRADSLWILSLTKLFGTSGELNYLDRVTAIRRGYSYPLMLSLGPRTEYLSAFTPFAYLVLFSCVIWAIRSLSRSKNTQRILLTSLGIVAVLATAVMPLRIMYYIGPHALVAIGYTLSATVVAIAVRDGMLTRTNRVVLLLGFALAAVSTAEALAILVVISLPLLARKWLSISDARYITLAATIPFAIWLATYNSYLIQITGLVWYVVCPIFVLLGLLTVQFAVIRQSAIIWVPAGYLTYLLVMAVVFPKQTAEGNLALIQNLFLGFGDWGAVPYVLVFALIFVLFASLRSATTELKAMLYLMGVTVLGSLVAKLLAGGQLGDPAAGRFAWTDSLNRMWFHLLPLAVVAIVIGIAQQDWLWEVQKSGKLDEARPKAKAKNP